MHEAKTRLSELVESACRGEDVYLARNGQVVARIVPVTRGRKHRLGTAKGLIDIHEDFYKPLSDSELKEFLGL